MTEKSLHEAVCDYIRLQYPNARFKTDLSGASLLGRKAKAHKKRVNASHNGFPDLIIYERRGAYCGLALELKAEGKSPFKKDGSLKKDEHLEAQSWWLYALAECGFKATFATGFDEAKVEIDQYFKLHKN